MAVQKVKKVTFRATKQELFNVLDTTFPTLFGSHKGATFGTGPGQFDFFEDENDNTKMTIVFTEENEPNP